MVSNTLQTGFLLNGNSYIYKIERVLGQGSFGITYLASVKMAGALGTIDANIKVAIKEFFMRDVNQRAEDGSITGLTEGSLSYNYAQKFRKEAERLAAMSHPNIIKVMDFVEANNTFYYVMEFIDGENLNDYLKHHKMSEKEATDTISEVAKALQYMHEEKHMLHLDLKPGNIMRRNNDGHIYLIDFGLSKHFSEDGVPETSTSVGLGTPGYAPIEQANSKNAKQFRATLDVYALGATFFKLLTGQTPPSADELVSDEDLISDELTKYDIGKDSKVTIVHSMKPNVKHRTQDVKGFLADLYPQKSEIVSAPDDDEVTVIVGKISPAKEEKSDKEDIKVTITEEIASKKRIDNILKLYIPGAIILCCIIVLVILHSTYRYAYWWVDEEFVIGGALSIFMAILLVYYIIIKNKWYGRK